MLNYRQKIKYVFLSLFIIFIIFIIVTACIKNNIEKTNNDNPYINTNNNNSTISSSNNIISSVPTQNYHTVTLDNTEIYNGELVLVNYNYECKFNGKDTINLINYKSSSYLVADGNVMLNNGTPLTALNTMLNEFFQNTGLDNILVSCGFRDREYQRKLYEREIANLGEEGAKWVAKPGYSEHQTGYTIDLSLWKDGLVQAYTGSGQYSWVAENCKNYGYILRYPYDKTEITKINNEEWHFRYVGVPHATYISNNNLCLEEYINYLKNISIENPITITIDNLYTDNQNHTYDIYYVKASDSSSTEIPLPSENCNYAISGNNVDGFIVTIDK